MAAGIGSRFGGGIKQLEPIGPNNELIIHYSIYDAIKAGFNKNNFLLECNETKNIQKKNNIIISDSGNISELNFVSMNMWGLTPDFICELEKRFVNFLENLSEPEKEEFLLPIIIDNMIKEKIARVKLLKTNDKWFGVTYKEDTEYVKKSINSLIKNNIYPEKLF